MLLKASPWVLPWSQLYDSVPTDVLLVVVLELLQSIKLTKIFTSLSELFFLEFIVGFAYEESHRGIPKKHRCVSMGDRSLERGRNHFGGQKNYLLLHIYAQMGIELTHLCCFLHSIICGIWGSEILVADKSLASLVQLW